MNPRRIRAVARKETFHVLRDFRSLYLAFAIPLLLILLASVRTPLYHPRYVFTYSPAFYILLALAVDKVVFDLARRRTRVQAVVTGALLGVLVLASGYSLDRYWFDPINAEDDLRGAVAHLAGNAL